MRVVLCKAPIIILLNIFKNKRKEKRGKKKKKERKKRKEKEKKKKKQKRKTKRNVNERNASGVLQSAHYHIIKYL